MSILTPSRDQVERVVRSILSRRVHGNGQAARGRAKAAYRPNLVVNISARHAHLSQEHVEHLFGPGADLTVMKPLYQDTEFAANETVAVVGPRQRTIPRVRILGPCRRFSQVELAFHRLDQPGHRRPGAALRRHRGQGTPGCVLIGSKGHVVLEQGIIRAERHVHMGPKDSEYYGVEHLDRMDLSV